MTLLRLARASMVVLLLLVGGGFVPPPTVATVDLAAAPRGGLVLTFDNGYATQLAAAQILESHGMRGTFYVIAQDLRQGPWYTDFLSPTDLQNLTARGHDIESGTLTHADLSTLAADQRQHELLDSKQRLETITRHVVSHVAYPYGSASSDVLNDTAGVYRSGRILTSDPNDSLLLTDQLRVPALIVSSSTTLESAKSYVDFAVAHNVTIVLEFQGIRDPPAPWDWSAANLTALADYAVAQGVPTRTMTELFASFGPTAPSATSVSARANATSVQLSWPAAADGGSPILGYDVLRGSASGGETLLARLANGSMYVDANVTTNTTYYYQVAARNAVGSALASSEASATTAPPSTAGIVFTFDNGYASHVQAAATLASKKFAGTFYPISQDLRVGPWYTDYMSAQDLANLTAKGHEVGSRSVDYADLTTLAPDQLQSELLDSKTRIESASGRVVGSIAYPYGATSPSVINATLLVYRSGRILTSDPNDFLLTPRDPYRVPALIVSNATPLAKVQSYVDFAKANNVTVVLDFQRIVANPGPYDWSATDFAALVDYVQKSGVPVRTMSDVFWTPPPTPPGTPIVSAIAGNARVNLTWTTPVTGGSPVTAYNLYRGNASGGETLLATLGANATFLDRAVTNNATYWYQVSARNALGEGVRSREVSAKPANVTGAIVLTFDDAYVSHYAAGTTLESYGMRGTFFITWNFTTAVNGTDPDYMGRPQVKLLAQHGHDIEAHTMDHPDLTTLTPGDLDWNLRQTQLNLQALTGQPVLHLAYPFGATNATVEAQSARYYASARGYTNAIPASGIPPVTDRYAVYCVGIERATTLAAAEHDIDLARDSGATLVLAFHRIQKNKDPYDWDPANFAALVAYVAGSGVKVKTYAEALGG